MVVKKNLIRERFVNRQPPQMYRSDDVIPGCSQRGLSPIRLDQAAPERPQHTTPLEQHNVNCGIHLWPIRLHCQETARVDAIGGSRKGQQQPFQYKNILIFSCLQITRSDKTFLCLCFPWNPINFALSTNKKKAFLARFVLILWAFGMWEAQHQLGERRANTSVLLTKG